MRLDLRRGVQALEDRDAQIAALRKQIDAGVHLEGVEIDDLFVVSRIEIVSRSGGVDLDGQPGDDGVRVYVRPMDAAGDVIKAAGQFTVQLVDVSEPGQSRDLGVCVFDDPEKLARCWYGGMLTNHFTFDCPFQPGDGQPRGREVLVRVTLLDWLTGRLFSDSATVQIRRIDPENALAPHRG